MKISTNSKTSKNLKTSKNWKILINSKISKNSKIFTNSKIKTVNFLDYFRNFAIKDKILLIKYEYYLLIKQINFINYEIKL